MLWIAEGDTALTGPLDPTPVPALSMASSYRGGSDEDIVRLQCSNVLQGVLELPNKAVQLYNQQ